MGQLLFNFENEKKALIKKGFGVSIESEYGFLPIENKVCAKWLRRMHNTTTAQSSNQAHERISSLPKYSLGIEGEMQRRGHTEDQE